MLRTLSSYVTEPSIAQRTFGQVGASPTPPPPDQAYAWVSSSSVSPNVYLHQVGSDYALSVLVNGASCAYLTDLPTQCSLRRVVTQLLMPQ